MLCKLGEIEFLKEIESFRDENSEVFAEQALIFAKPILQHTGTELQTLEFGMVFHYSFCLPDKNYKSLKEAMKKAEPLALSWGDGKFVGYFVITHLNGEFTQKWEDGKTMAMTVSVSLKECSPKKTNNSALAIKKNNTAVNTQLKPVKFTPRIAGNPEDRVVATTAQQVTRQAWS